MSTDVALGLAALEVGAEREEVGEEGGLDGEDIVKIWDFFVLHHLLDDLGEVGGGVALTEFGDILCVDIHIIIYTRARRRLGGFRGVVVEVLLGMGGVGQYLVVAAVDIDVYRGLFFCHFIGFLWSYDMGWYGRTFKGSMDVRP